MHIRKEKKRYEIKRKQTLHKNIENKSQHRSVRKEFNLKN